MTVQKGSKSTFTEYWMLNVSLSSLSKRPPKHRYVACDFTLLQSNRQVIGGILAARDVSEGSSTVMPRVQMMFGRGARPKALSRC